MAMIYFFSRFGQFISSTLPTFAVCEKFVIMENTNEEKIDRGESAFLSFQVSKKHFSSILLQHNNTSDHPVKESDLWESKHCQL